MSKIIEQLPQPGDVIYVYRRWGVYQHFGVYIGNVGRLKNQVIHFSGKKKDITFSDVAIIQTSLKEFLRGGEMHIQKPNLNGWDPFPVEQIIRNAKGKLGKKKYNIVFNNCEHFANYCRFGKHKSGQVVRAFQKVGVFIAGVAAVFFLAPKKHNNDRT